MNELNDSRIGIDIGRVVMCPTDEVTGPDTSFLSAKAELAMQIPPAPGAEAVIRTLVARTGGSAWYVSKAGRRVQALTKEWFRHNDFHTRSGIAAERLLFCFKRHEKARIAERLRLTHFIDDRLDVLEPMRGIVPHLLLFGVQSRPAPPWVTPVRDWNAIARLLLREGDERERNVIGQPHAVG